MSDDRWIESDRDAASAVTHFSRAGQIAVTRRSRLPNWPVIPAAETIGVPGTDRPQRHGRARPGHPQKLRCSL